VQNAAINLVEFYTGIVHFGLGSLLRL